MRKRLFTLKRLHYFGDEKDDPECYGCEDVLGKTRNEAEERMHEAISMHVRGLIEDGMPVPESHSSASFIAVRAE